MGGLCVEVLVVVVVVEVGVKEERYLNKQQDEMYAKCKQVSLCCLSSVMNTLGTVVIISPLKCNQSGSPVDS